MLQAYTDIHISTWTHVSMYHIYIAICATGLHVDYIHIARHNAPVLYSYRYVDTCIHVAHI